jgi:SAM-dependent methyltransferase
MDNSEYFLFDIRRLTAGGKSRNLYDSLYQERDLEQIQSFYLWLMDRMYAAGMQAQGLDISEIVARTAFSRARGMITVGAGEDLPFADASFDIVTNIGSLEHFTDPLAGTVEMARVLKRTGRAFILVPNTFSLLNNVWTAFRTGRTAVDEQPIQRYGARADWVALIRAGGLAVRQTIKYERAWPRLARDWHYYLSRPKELLRLLATPFVPLNLAWCFLFVCELPD